MKCPIELKIALLKCKRDGMYILLYEQLILPEFSLMRTAISVQVHETRGEELCT